MPQHNDYIKGALRRHMWRDVGGGGGNGRINQRCRKRDRPRPPQTRDMTREQLAGLPTPASLLHKLGNLDSFRTSLDGAETQSLSSPNPFQQTSRRNDHSISSPQQKTNPFSRVAYHPGNGPIPLRSRDLSPNSNVVQQQEFSEADRTKLANILLKYRLLALRQAVDNEFGNCIRLWCEAVGIQDNEAEPMDWQPEKETTVQFIFIHTATPTSPSSSPASPDSAQDLSS